MRSRLGCLLFAACASTTESHGTTAKQYGGTVPVVFINATPERLCGLYISFENEPEYGDNWLPRDGLAVGQSLELKIKAGTYKAKWNTCKDARDRPTVSYAATLVGGTAFLIAEPVQLYAFVSDGVPPTKRGVPKPRMKMIKFIGQQTEIAAVSAPASPDTPPPTEVSPEASRPEPPPQAERAPPTGPLPPVIWVAPPPAAPPPPPPPPPPPAVPPLGPPGSTLFSPK